MNRRINSRKAADRSRRSKIARQFTAGDAVERINPKHRNGVAVVVSRKGTRIEVQTSVGVTEVWYADSAQMA